jgi:parallel beta-helix repeat protein
MSKSVFGLLLILLFISLATLALEISPVKASFSITINGDGSIFPQWAPLSTSDNLTYTLTGNVTSEFDGVVIERDNIIFNGAGYTVQGVGSSSMINGISLIGRCNDTVENVNVNGFECGIELSICYVGNNTITGNNVTNNWDGIYCITVYNDNCIAGNNITNNGFGIVFWHASNDSITGNNISANQSAGILLISSQYNTIMGNNITNNQWGINTECGNEGDPIPLSSDNNIYLNNFINNSEQVNMSVVMYDSSVTALTPNNWDNGTYGNYWSNYNGTEIDHSGIGDTLYIIDASNADHFPLIHMVPEFSSFLILPFFMIATLLAVAFYKKKTIQYKRL